jgi:hypothetical protein
MMRSAMEALFASKAQSVSAASEPARQHTDNCMCTPDVMWGWTEVLNSAGTISQEDLDNKLRDLVA